MNILPRYIELLLLELHVTALIRQQAMFRPEARFASRTLLRLNQRHCADEPRGRAARTSRVDEPRGRATLTAALGTEARLFPARG